ncbi:2-amino-4-hydroxy-6-hydroxymethyldihydropteridine diphosphokinase [Aliiroseovarius sp. 2305UL8-7]|uniref:2-amino-4-hydroxy-6- hydroxymethyldihydropteridine diphosphokinase n=1 Tax=Aliiroseovarius conchicola TaxID=3121637 RepID=UPI003527E6F0
MPQVKSSQETCTKVLVSLGSNATSALADSAKLLSDAIGHIATQGFRITKSSGYYSTPCFPAGAGPDFVNAAIEIESDKPPHAVLEFLHEVEAHFGRERPSRWAPRSLDLDLIAYGDTVLPSKAKLKEWMALPLEVQKRDAPDELILPHPRMHERSFVLIPLIDIAPDWEHPILAKTVRELADQLSGADKMGVQPFPPP